MFAPQVTFYVRPTIFETWRCKEVTRNFSNYVTCHHISVAPTASAH